MESKLKTIISELTELYQPIFKHPNLSKNVSRLCDDRLVVIERAYDAIAKELGRPLSVLDLGCAQGYFSLNLASKGAKVLGIDYEKNNIEICDLLAQEANLPNATFVVDEVERFIESDFKKYDLVLGLSIFHHITESKSKEYSKSLINKLAINSKAILLELAQNSEPLYWACSQPIDVRFYLEEISFCHVLGNFQTHLSDIKRPLFFASNSFCYFGKTLTKFTSVDNYPHHFAKTLYKNTRKYFFCEQSIVKQFQRDEEFSKNVTELRQEISFLKNPPRQLTVPEIQEYGENSNEIWAKLSKIEGDLLINKIIHNKEIFPKSIIYDVLNQLLILEKNNLFHNDVRIWNIIIDENNYSWLIDYGSIQQTKEDCVWPNDIFMSFAIFIWEVTNKVIDDPSIMRSVKLSPLHLPIPYRYWMEAMWELPMDQWSFEKLLKTFQLIDEDNSTKKRALSTIYTEITSIENAIQIQKNTLTTLINKIDELTKSIAFESITISDFTKLEENLQIQINQTQYDVTKLEENLQIQINQNQNDVTKLEENLQIQINQNQNDVTKLEENLQIQINQNQFDVTKLEENLQIQINTLQRQLNQKNLISKILNFLSKSTRTLKYFIYIPHYLSVFLTDKLIILILRSYWLRFIGKKILANNPSLADSIRRFLLLRDLSIQNRFSQPINECSKIALSLNENTETYLIYVDHTVTFGANTGLQRVARVLSKSLVKQNKNVYFVKWNSSKTEFVLLNRLELQHLCHWNGPGLDEIDLSLYPENQSSGSIIPSFKDNSIAWLLIPEVTYISPDMKDRTAWVIRKAKAKKIKTCFVFFDAIPLLRNEYSHISDTHFRYMRKLEQADIILSISNWSKNKFEELINTSNQFVGNLDVLPLPAESILKPRTCFIREFTKQIEKSILCVGSISIHKNQLLLIDAFNNYCLKNKDSLWKLIIIGHVSFDLQKTFIEKIKNNKNIIHISSGSDDDLRDAYEKCAFTVFPSLEEGFGLPILESLWFGKPCVCAKFGSMAEVASIGGCIKIDTNNLCDIERAINELTLSPEKLINLHNEISSLSLSTWDEYASSLLRKLKAFEETQKNKFHEDELISSKRLFWLGMHKVLTKTELIWLRELGFEVFNPPYLSDVKDQSAEMNWDKDQYTTLPKDVFDKLSGTNFFYDEIDDDIGDLLNQYFDAVIVTIAPVWLEQIVKNYKGPILYRVYGQTFSITNEFSIRDIKKYIENKRDFYFMPHSLKSLENEESWFRKQEIEIPYSLRETYFEHKETWQISTINDGEVALSCPNISNPFFKEHYDFIKKHFNAPYFKIYGVQLEQFSDVSIVGTLSQEELINKWKNIACFLYTYTDPNVCYLPPIEIMVIGGPVLFLKGSLLDKYFSGIDTPARCYSTEDAITKINRIRDGDEKLCLEIISYQKIVINLYRPDIVKPKFNKAILETILGS